MNKDTGINTEAMDKLILDIYKYGERISETLQQISDIVEGTKGYYSCSAATNYRSGFNQLKANFNIVNKNVISYATDLLKVKNRYENINDDISAEVKRAALNLEKDNYKQVVE